MQPSAKPVSGFSATTRPIAGIDASHHRRCADHYPSRDRAADHPLAFAAQRPPALMYFALHSCLSHAVC